MILKPSELLMVKRGRPWFALPHDPGLREGDVVRLRETGKDDGIVVTVHQVTQENGKYKVRFTPGDTRPEEMYVAAGWPDYTTDTNRAMRDELPPMPDTFQERKDRIAWLMLALGHGNTTPMPARPKRPKSTRSQTTTERVTYTAGSPEAINIVRQLFREHE